MTASFGYSHLQNYWLLRKFLPPQHVPGMADEAVVTNAPIEDSTKSKPECTDEVVASSSTAKSSPPENVIDELEEGEIVLEKTHPQLVELSRRNGQINRMNVVQMRNELRALGLTTFGSKQVLRKRLKAAVVRTILKHCNDQKVRKKLVGRNRAPRFLVVLDFEATCGDQGNTVQANGIGKPKVVKKQSGPTFTEKLRQVRDSMSQSHIETSNDTDEPSDAREIHQNSDDTNPTASLNAPVATLKQLAERSIQQRNSTDAECDGKAGPDANSPHEKVTPVLSRGGHSHEQIQEIIEFPAYFVDTHELTIIGAPFHSFVRPLHSANRKLTQFCTALTGIVQSDVETAPPFPEVLVAFKRWLVALLRAHDPRVIRRFGCVSNQPVALASEIEATMLKAAHKADVNNNSDAVNRPSADLPAHTNVSATCGGSDTAACSFVDLNSSFLETALMHLRALQAANETVKSIFNQNSTVSAPGTSNATEAPIGVNTSEPELTAMGTKITGLALNDIRLGDAPLEVCSASNEHCPVDLDPQDEEVLMIGDFAIAFDSAVDISVFLRTSASVSDVQVPRYMREWVNLKKCYCNFYTLPKTSLGDMLRSVQLDFVGRPHRGLDDAHNLARLALRLSEDGASLRKNERLLDRPANERGVKPYKTNEDQIRVRYYEPIRNESNSRHKQRDPRELPLAEDELVEIESDECEDTQEELLYLHSLKRSAEV